VDNGGIIKLVGAFQRMAGDFHITGQMDGKTAVAGDLLSAGRIAVDGNVGATGEITVGGFCDGNILTGQMGGSIEVGDDLLLDGSITVDGNLGATGEITVNGLCDGNILIGKRTASGSLISLPGGLGLNGIVTVNDTLGPFFKTSGTIHVGPDVQPADVEFNGSIRIMKDFGGVIKVVGCHATGADLDICICGDNLGSVEIVQLNCSNQVG
ncbi:MAG: hypothetical protein IIC01_11465, partial [Planctomycetes bacterium]|nr:hypothetical protein [Planctomycetota bacterium]